MLELWLPLSMVLLLFAGILSGYPVALVLGGVSAIFLLFSDLPLAFSNLMLTRVYANALSNWLYVAIPMFIMMGLLLERTGLARDAFRVSERLLRRLPGHLALTVLFIGGLMAATTGVVGASVVLLAVLALPRMLDAGYSASASAGLISASGTLAILMPPSVMLIILSSLVSVPVGHLFKAALIPSALLLLLYTLYSLALAWRQRHSPLADIKRPDEQQGGGVGRNLLALFPFLVLIPIVLGTIVYGVATPTEASGVGVLAVLGFAGVMQKIDVESVMTAARETVVSTAMIMMLVITATCFSLIFKGVGGDGLIRSSLGLMGGGSWSVLILILLLVFVLGFFLDWLEISLILMPIFVPIITQLELSNGLTGGALLVWFAILFAINLQTSFLTPPFGVSLFYLKGAVGDRVATLDIYRGVLPFIAIQLFVLLLILLFPGLLML
ncbi:MULTISPECIES: TRAP transporter large permease [Halomonadaceae]|uniref:TRAP transporter large permease n=1 Tax=Halomonadaceae TaxID=28256 RepID=UPI0012F45DFF|nr:MULTISPECIES: TRAP transporter large permease subunit [Halomonas]CAD5248569.1 C4-dicarboxylate ABC transporter [Halomonas sp. 156]CAD5265019.1 C4-dicarboxylate ABC transporter [Halomonas sp. 113]CAD5267265.1 C4-dicarboxylate ABC transporter [Halomonas sp. 59]CAD5279659.1 C4-dicarboxylate ABC transporter [Halomonas sp. I3]VXB60197.1 C4-dicarboxylate ABC transporter [Halomonas titanicae]